MVYLQVTVAGYVTPHLENVAPPGGIIECDTLDEPIDIFALAARVQVKMQPAAAASRTVPSLKREIRPLALGIA